jgi:hypothetical protein
VFKKFNGEKMSFKEKVKHEIKEVGIVTLYFLVCFAIILLLKKLFLAEYEIEFNALSAAVIGALVIGKVVVILDKTAIGNRFGQSHAGYIDVLYRSLVYTFFVALVVFAEKVFHASHEAEGFIPAVRHALEKTDINHLWATVIGVFLSFIGYNVLNTISHHLGEGELVRLFFSSKKKREVIT